MQLHLRKHQEKTICFLFDLKAVFRIFMMKTGNPNVLVNCLTFLQKISPSMHKGDPIKNIMVTLFFTMPSAGMSYDFEKTKHFDKKTIRQSTV
jgi:hypothetical protein